MFKARFLCSAILFFGCAYNAQASEVGGIPAQEGLQHAFHWLIGLGALYGIAVFLILFGSLGVAIWISTGILGVQRTFWACIGSGLLGWMFAVPVLILLDPIVQPWREYENLINLSVWTVLITISVWIVLRPGVVRSILVSIIAQILFILVLLSVIYLLSRVVPPDRIHGVSLMPVLSEPVI
jgi:hypothetical protein